VDTAKPAGPQYSVKKASGGSKPWTF
jgi:hypothetical protein